MWRMLVIGLLCMQLVACSQAASKPQTKIEHAMAVCINRNENTSLSAYIEENELHLTLFFDNSGIADTEKSNQRGVYQLVCILEDLSVPQKINQQIVKSNNIQGLHTEEFGNLTISWVITDSVRIVIREQ